MGHPALRFYDRYAQYYDSIYSFKNYRKESNKLDEFIHKYKRSRGKDLLDVACGTGNHIAFLKKRYHVQGLDLSPQMLEIAREKNPEITFHQGDMTDFQLAQQFDAVTCLFSAIGHVRSRKKLEGAIRRMAAYLKPGGLLLVEPWFSPNQWQSGRLDAKFVNDSALKLARISINGRRGRLSIMNLQYLVGTPRKIEHLVERVEMMLFTGQEYLNAFRRVGLTTIFDKRGLIGRGLYLGIRPLR